MLQALMTSSSRWLLACAVLIGSAAIGTDGFAQMQPGAAPPPQPQQAAPAGNPMCQRLEGQLATIDRGAGSGDPAKDEQIRRYQEAQTQQQAQLDRVIAQANRMGCESSGFFSLFSGQSAQCGPVNNQIQQMRGNLDQITTSLERLRSGGLGGADRENQRRSVLTALAQNNCGPQYAAAAREQSQGGFLGGLFGNNTIAPPPGDLGAAAGTFRTVCVRSCDGAYFPVSFATVPARFPDDDKTCKQLCPAAEATLFTYRNPGEDMNQAVSITGQQYTALPNAFKFRSEFNPSCSCKAAGQTWSDALKSVDDKDAVAQQGDIIVTEESAKKMQQQKMQQQKTAPPPPARKAPPLPPRPRARRRPRRSCAAADRRRQGQADPFGWAAIPAEQSDDHALTAQPSNASADTLPARETRLSSGFGIGLPVSRKRLVMG